MTQSCQTCEHFDKSAYPKNPIYGRCNYILPSLPRWVPVANPQFRAVAKTMSRCDTYKESKC